MDMTKINYVSVWNLERLKVLFKNKKEKKKKENAWGKFSFVYLFAFNQSKFKNGARAARPTPPGAV